MREKVLLDTDIGSDIDDAVCLAYLLAHPACELLGVTTVSGEAEKRAQMVSAMCRVAGVDVPIYPGTESPLFIGPKQPLAAQAVALSRWSHQSRFPRGQAVSFLRDVIRAHPGAVTLLAIGPLTNVGLLFSMDPEIPGLLKRLVLMGGVYTTPRVEGPLCEWNAACDPHAASIVYRYPATAHRSVGLDVTLQVRMSAAEVKSRFTAPLLTPVLDFAHVWFERSGQITFHDPLAATTIFDPAICRFARGTVEVELASPRLAGLTYWTPDEQGCHEVAVGVTPDRFFDQFFSVF